ncbi:MAG: glycoside hydrolase family 9 protein [Saprospiraceae bacterium]|nr:glycoside hydrolase family 9 protein [Saprospiraceae bacterium]
MVQNFTILSLLFLCTIASIAQPSAFIQVDQFGYQNGADKIAVINDPQSGYNASQSYTVGNPLEVKEFLSDQTVFSGAPLLWNMGNTHSQSGDKGWWFDFSSVTTDGTYYIYDPSTGHKSAPFVVSDNPYYEVLQAALKAFYYNRCNAPKEQPYAASSWTDTNNFLHPGQDHQCRYIGDPNNAALAKDLRGGWFDAGDYNKYVTFAYRPVHDLLSSYEEHPSLFGDDWSWPESGNQLPDILDEVKWELHWLMRMLNQDGSAHIKMGSNSYSVNILAPPSLNSDPRFYGPTCTSASIAVAAMFAHASLVYAQIPSQQSFADSLENSAINAWNYFKVRFDANTLETNCDDGSIIAGDADWSADDQKSAAIVASVYLYTLTGQSAYNTFVADHFDEVEPISNQFWGPYRNDINEALLLYTTLSGANASAKTTILNSAATDVANNYNGFFNLGLSDLYRVHAPDWMYHWGSNMPIANMGNLCQIMIRYNVAPSSESMMQERTAEIVHYFHGVNPQGLVYLSNMYAYGGDRCANEIYHTWFNDGTDWDNALTSAFGPAPGFVVGGANKDFSPGSPSPPSGQPPQKSYKDFNTGYPQNSWEITEPAIYYQAAYIRLLANYTSQLISTNTSANIHLTQNCVEIYPNPTNNYFHVNGTLDRYKLEIFNSSGVLYQTIPYLGGEAVIDMSDLPSGLFFIRIENRQNKLLCIQKILKQD